MWVIAAVAILAYIWLWATFPIAAIIATAIVVGLIIWAMTRSDDTLSESQAASETVHHDVIVVDSKTGEIIEPMSDEEYGRISAEIERNREMRLASKRVRQVRGRDPWDHMPEIAQLKRDGQLEEALALIYECMDASARSDQVELAFGSYLGTEPSGRWWNEAGIVLRRMGDCDSEVRLLERLLDEWPKAERIKHRLDKAKQLQAKHGTDL